MPAHCENRARQGRNHLDPAVTIVWSRTGQAPIRQIVRGSGWTYLTAAMNKLLEQKEGLRPGDQLWVETYDNGGEAAC